MYDCENCDGSGVVPLFMGIETIIMHKGYDHRLAETCIDCHGKGEVNNRRIEANRVYVSVKRNDGTIIDSNGYIKVEQRIENRRISP